jgi:peptide/nickel transport system permease protein
MSAKNPLLFRVAIFTLILYLLLSFFGIYFITDQTPNANRQIPEWANLPPFTSRTGFVNPMQTNIVQPQKHEHTQPINLTFWLGTDVLGRDLMSRLIVAGQTSLIVGIASVGIALLIGVSLGMIAGYFGGIIDVFIQGVMTLTWSLPSVLLALILSFVLGKGLLQLCIAIALTLWVDMARIVRSQTMTLRQKEFVTAGKAIGLTTFPILVSYILPNLWGIILILVCANFATAILLEAGLSFLGMGINPPTPSWGNMMNEGYQYLILEQGKRMAIYPALVLVVLIFSVNIVSSGLKGAIKR